MSQWDNAGPVIADKSQSVVPSLDGAPFPVSVQGSVATTGGLTDTQLRASAVPVSAKLFAEDPSAVDAALKVDSSSRLITNPLASLGTPRVQATSAAAASIVLTSTCRRVSMLATTGTWYSLTGTATTTSHYIAAGERLDFSVPASTTISVLQETSAGSIRISELA